VKYETYSKNNKLHNIPFYTLQTTNCKISKLTDFQSAITLIKALKNCQ